LLSATANASEQNYHQCLTAEHPQQQLADMSLMQWCASRHFDTAPTAIQARVMLPRLDELKQRDARFRAFYDTVRNSGSNAIYSDQQILLMYLDNREVNKD